MGMRPSHRVAQVANALGFQCVWFATVAGAGSGRPWAGPLVVAIFALMTLALSTQRRADLMLVAIALPFGYALDSVWVRVGLLEFAHAWPSQDWAPLWILSLWAGFALTINHSLSAVCQRPALAVTLGAIGGPLAYFAAERGFAAVVLAAPTSAVVGVIGAAWAVIVPSLALASARVSQHPGPVVHAGTAP
jgi:hypothetical protein